MSSMSRRTFLRAAPALGAACTTDLGFMASLSRAAAQETRMDPAEVRFGPETDRLLDVLHRTPGDACVAAFVREMQAGLSYRQFLTVLFLAAVRGGDPHQVAQVYAAHRISSEARVDERLLPLFWALHRVKAESEPGAPANAAFRRIQETLPAAGRAEALLREAILQSDSDTAERAALALARARGPRFVMDWLWEFAPRNVGGTLGHTAIAHANSQRALEALGWQHAEVPLRYSARVLAGFRGDRTYTANLHRARRTVRSLPEAWAGQAGETAATLELYQVLRRGQADAAADLICAQLGSGQVQAGAVWDAICLAASDTVVRYKTGGKDIGAVQIHAITTTNALRHGFQQSGDARVRLLNLLQAAGVTADFFVNQPAGEGQLRDVNLVGLKASAVRDPGPMREVFELLPFKDRGYVERRPEERAASDQACALAFDLFTDPGQATVFKQAARSFLCVKATLDPHDMKYPAAIFEDAESASPEWRPYLLASSVHALHGSRSRDSAVLAEVREALR